MTMVETQPKAANSAAVTSSRVFPAEAVRSNVFSILSAPFLAFAVAIIAQL